ncbi:tRNA dihydrouridine(16) synthase DusC [Sessilibacter sp. MAH1]
MEGVVDFHMRKILTEIGGIDGCVTEFIRVTNHALPSRVFLKHFPEILSDCETEHRVPVSVQLLGSNPEAIALNAVKASKIGAKTIDLNFGCPAKTVNKSEGGAILLKKTDTLFKIVSTTKQSLPQGVKLSAKMRLGYEEKIGFLENAQALESAGAEELVVHARSKVDGYKPPAYWSYVKAIQEQLSINVIINGEIWTVDDYFKARDQSGCVDVMIGRGLLAKPDLALQIKCALNGEPIEAMPWCKVAHYVLRYFLQTTYTHPNKFLGNRLKQWLSYLKLTYPEAHVLMEDIKRSRDFDFIHNRLRIEINNNKIDATI